MLLRQFFLMTILLTGFSFNQALASETVKIKVKGMVCSFCSSGIKKKFSSLDEVQSVDVNMDEKLVVVSLKDGKMLEDKAIEDLITESGFNVDSMSREK